VAAGCGALELNTTIAHGEPEWIDEHDPGIHDASGQTGTDGHVLIERFAYKAMAHTSLASRELRI